VPIEHSDAPAVPAAVERFVKQLVVTLKAVLLYPSASSIPRENAQEAADLLRAVLRDSAEVRFKVSKTGLAFGSLVVFEGQPAFESFARELYNRGLAEVRFHAGATADDIVRFLGILKTAPGDLASAGGFENRLWDLGVDSITVKQAAARIVDTNVQADAEAPAPEEWPPSAESIDEILAAAFGGRPRDQRVLVRVLQDPAVLAGYLKETHASRGSSVDEALQAMPVRELAHMAAQQSVDVRPRLFHALAEAIADLEPEIRRALLTEKLLPDARTDEAIANVLRQMDIDFISRVLVEGLSDDTVSVEGLARAIRNLALISLSGRDDVINAAGAAMRHGGLSDETVEDVLDAVTPSRLTVGGAAETEQAQEQSVDSILKMIDLAPTRIAQEFEQDPGYVKVQEESRRGLTDGDVVRALVTLTAVDAGGEHFDDLMSEIEDTIGLLIDRGDFDVAADAAEAMVATIEQPELDPERRQRALKALQSLGTTDGMRSVTKALRMYRAGTAEHEACKRLLEALGRGAIDPLLEVLADEPDMAARKALVDLVSDIAAQHIDELGARVSDPRWYVARNVVAILGRTRVPEILPALGRTLRHSDARVRRETIRALAGVQDKLADEMLVAALDDPDAQNVQLAARYLGVARTRGAVEALERVAAGEGRGNRDTGPRVEAIEALGHIGASRSVPVLETLAGKRSLLASGRARELRSAAAASLRAIAACDARGGESS